MLKELIKPKWISEIKEYKNREDIPEEVLKKWEEDEKIIDEQNKIIEKENRDRYNAWVKEGQNIFNDNKHKVIKCIEKTGNKPRGIWPNAWMGTIRVSEIRKEIEGIKKFKKDKELNEKIKKDQEIYLQDAIIYLQEKGKILGKNFIIENAIYLANDIARDLEIKHIQEELKGGYMSFSGDDSCENCKGWDGVSHRCDCGNRRVEWVWEGDFKNPYVYAEAY
jgi:hypothetical protein